jgi:hypothetical protein
MRGGSWGFVIVYGREADIMIIDVVGISSSTMAIGGSSVPLSRCTREVEGAWENWQIILFLRTTFL